jgi:hypothetical protein
MLFIYLLARESCNGVSGVGRRGAPFGVAGSTATPSNAYGRVNESLFLFFILGENNEPVGLKKLPRISKRLLICLKSIISWYTSHSEYRQYEFYS